jgi:hypothetical protein
MGEEEAAIRPYQIFKFISPLANRRFFLLQHLIALSFRVPFCGTRNLHRLIDNPDYFKAYCKLALIHGFLLLTKLKPQIPIQIVT